MPKTAQYRAHGRPLAALLILLSLFLGPAAANGSEIGGPARLGSNRHGPATALLPAGTRNSLEDEAPGAGPCLLSSGPDVVTERLWARPWAEPCSSGRTAVPRPAGASYRARAPPAS